MAEEFARTIDPGNEPSKAKPHSLPWLMDFVRRHDGACLNASEALLLVNEVDRLRLICQCPHQYVPCSFDSPTPSALVCGLCSHTIQL